MDFWGDPDSNQSTGGEKILLSQLRLKLNMNWVLDWDQQWSQKKISYLLEMHTVIFTGGIMDI